MEKCGDVLPNEMDNKKTETTRFAFFELEIVVACFHEDRKKPTNRTGVKHGVGNLDYPSDRRSCFSLQVP